MIIFLIFLNKIDSLILLLLRAILSKPDNIEIVSLINNIGNIVPTIFLIT